MTSKEETIIAPIDRQLIKAELTQELFLRSTNKAGNEIYIFRAADAPYTMQEVGRLREESFRFYGGGTGKSVDIDDFDTDPEGYMQLIVWDPSEEAILGGYRFIFGSAVQIDTEGRPRLATAEMFRFSTQFLKEYLPHTIELGRSFVSLPYQTTRMGSKSMYALDNLWDGIGALTVLNPEMKHFYGKVTMYANYNREARNLILYFLELHFPDLEKLVTPIDPLPIEVNPRQVHELFPSVNFKANYRALNKYIRGLGINIPPLVNSYMSLSPEMRVFGTAINHGFGSVEEIGILISLDKILADKRERHIQTFSTSAEQMSKIWRNILKQVGLARR